MRIHAQRRHLLFEVRPYTPADYPAVVWLEGHMLNPFAERELRKFLTEPWARCEVAVPTLSADQQFAAVASLVQGIAEPVRRAACAMQYFGKGGVEILDLIMRDASTARAEAIRRGLKCECHFLVGFVACAVRRSSASIVSLAVDVNFRRCGVGRALLGAAAAKINSDLVTIVDDVNLDGLNFLKRIGFRGVQCVEHDGRGGIVMRRSPTVPKPEVDPT